MKKDEVIDEDLKVEGNIFGKDGQRFNIDAWDINACNINAWDIDALNIDTWDIICEKRIKKSENSETICRIYIKNKSKIERKEQID